MFRLLKWASYTFSLLMIGFYLGFIFHIRANSSAVDSLQRGIVWTENLIVDSSRNTFAAFKNLWN